MSPQSQSSLPSPVLPPHEPTDEELAGFQEAISKARPVVLPAGTGDIQISTGFVYFNADEPMEMPEPIILSGDEADLRNAIQALEPLLSAADRAKYRDYLDPKMPKSLRQRYRDWRERNGKAES